MLWKTLMYHIASQRQGDSLGLHEITLEQVVVQSPLIMYPAEDHHEGNFFVTQAVRKPRLTSLC